MFFRIPSGNYQWYNCIQASDPEIDDDKLLLLLWNEWTNDHYAYKFNYCEGSMCLHLFENLPNKHINIVIDADTATQSTDFTHHNYIRHDINRTLQTLYNLHINLHLTTKQQHRYNKNKKHMN